VLIYLDNCAVSELTFLDQAETFHPKDWFKADKDSHGYTGPLHTEPHDLAPISQLLMDSFVSQGLPLNHDMFSTGAVSHGCGHVPRTVYQGTRTTGADFVTNKNHSRNITIATDSIVDKVILTHEADDIRATGVVVKSSDGSSKTYYARKEIVVSGGAYCSPAILLRSGIGPREELEKHSIPCTVDLPGVGKNLMDHLVSNLLKYLLQTLTDPTIRSSLCSTKQRSRV
jgi:choline dehydrogenase-like flavoprotein